MPRHAGNHDRLRATVQRSAVSGSHVGPTPNPKTLETLNTNVVMLNDSGIKPAVKVVISVTRTQVVETEVQLLNRIASYEDETPTNL